MSQVLELTQTNRIASIEALDRRLRGLASWTIHYANHLRDFCHGLKLGRHQASCASISIIMAALYFHALGANDKVAGKPHAGPISGASFFDLSKSGHPLADRIVTTSPDVTVSTNPGAFENPLGPVA